VVRNLYLKETSFAKYSTLINSYRYWERLHSLDMLLLAVTIFRPKLLPSMNSMLELRYLENQRKRSYARMTTLIY